MIKNTFHSKKHKIIQDLISMSLQEYKPNVQLQIYNFSFTTIKNLKTIKRHICKLFFQKRKIK